MTTITATQAGKMLQVDGHTVRMWIEEKLLDGEIRPSKTGSRRRFTTTPEAVEEFRTKQARRLSLTHWRAKSQIGTTRPGAGPGPALPIRTNVVKEEAQKPPIASDPERRIAALEAQVRKLFGDADNARLAASDLRTQLHHVQEWMQNTIRRNQAGDGERTGPAGRALLRVLALLPTWLWARLDTGGMER
jgi:DNA-binding transcriptional MerR regulator